MNPSQAKKHSIAGNIQYWLEMLKCSRTWMSSDWSPVTRGRLVAKYPLLHGPPAYLFRLYGNPPPSNGPMPTCQNCFSRTIPSSKPEPVHTPGSTNWRTYLAFLAPPPPCPRILPPAPHHLTSVVCSRMMAASHPQAPPVLNTTPYHAIAIPEAPDATPKAQHLWRVAALLAAGGAVLLLTIGRLGAPEVAAFGHAGLTAPATSTTAAAAPAPTMARPMGHPPRATPQPLPAQPQAVASASGPTLGRAPATPAASGPSSRWLWALAAPLAAVACLWAAFDRRQRLGDRIALAAVTGRRAVYHVTKALPEDSSGGERAPLKSDGAGKSFASPTWVTEFFKALRGDDGSGIPVADAKLEDVTDLLGGALFLPLFKWMQVRAPSRAPALA